MKKPRKLSDAALRMLRMIHEHNDPTWGLVGMSAYGGATTTLRMLDQRALVESYEEEAKENEFTCIGLSWRLTDAGKKALGVS